MAKKMWGKFNLATYTERKSRLVLTDEPAVLFLFKL